MRLSQLTAMTTLGLISSLSLAATSFYPIETPQDVEKYIRFLISTAEQQGASYTAKNNFFQDNLLPLSYYSTAQYWGEYVCKLPGNNCEVTDVYNSANYTLIPDINSPGGDLQAERVNVANGTDIYDGATWQIAVALAGHNGLSSSANQSLLDMVDNQNKLLFYGVNGNDTASFHTDANRATTKSDGTFSYNGQSLLDPKNAYYFRMVSKDYIANDPLAGTKYDDYIKASNLPPDPQFQRGKITWLDWKPITGENAWGLLLGSLQADQIKYNAFKGTKNFIPYQSLSIQNAIKGLVSFQAMQSEIGGIYYATAGSLGNTGNTPVNPYDVSVENNASLLAGLLVLRHTLEQQLQYDNSADKAEIITALGTINTMLYGGQMPNGKITQGMLHFFKNYAWDKSSHKFLQGGLANEPGKAVWQPTYEPKAVDVTTWGLTVLGQPLVDEWFGFGSAYRAWQDVKKWGGFYGPDKTLWGVGYSDQDNNGPDNDHHQGILSAEWTAGAINMTRALITQYEAIIDDKDSAENLKTKAKAYVKSLKRDHDAMLEHLMSLRTDRYTTESAFSESRPKDYSKLIPMPNDKVAFLYASKRYFISFGWFANPIPSTTSTAWAVMLYYNFNPFSVDGSYQANDFSGGGASAALTHSVTATIHNEVNDAKISVNYRVSGNKEILHGPQLGKNANQDFTFPEQTDYIVFSYSKDNKNWYQACQILYPRKLEQSNLATIRVVWTNDQGTGECR